MNTIYYHFFKDGCYQFFNENAEAISKLTGRGFNILDFIEVPYYNFDIMCHNLKEQGYNVIPFGFKNLPENVTWESFVIIDNESYLIYKGIDDEEDVPNDFFLYSQDEWNSQENSVNFTADKFGKIYFLDAKYYKNILTSNQMMSAV